MKHEPFDDLFLVSQSNARRVNLVILGNRDLEKVCKHRLEHLRKALEERKKEPLVAQDCEAGLKAINFLQSKKVQAWQARALWYLLGGIVERVDVRLCSEYWKDGRKRAQDQALSKTQRGDAKRIRERRDAIQTILAGTDTRFIDEGKKLARQKKISLLEACRIIDEKHPELRLALLKSTIAHKSPVEGAKTDDRAWQKIVALLKERGIKASISTVRADVKAIYEQDAALQVERIKADE